MVDHLFNKNNSINQSKLNKNTPHTKEKTKLTNYRNMIKVMEQMRK